MIELGIYAKSVSKNKIVDGINSNMKIHIFNNLYVKKNYILFAVHSSKLVINFQ